MGFSKGYLLEALLVAGAGAVGLPCHRQALMLLEAVWVLQGILNLHYQEGLQYTNHDIEQGPLCTLGSLMAQAISMVTKQAAMWYTPCNQPLCLCNS